MPRLAVKELKNRKPGFGPGSQGRVETFSLYGLLSSPQQSLTHLAQDFTPDFKLVNARILVSVQDRVKKTLVRKALLNAYLLI